MKRKYSDLEIEVLEMEWFDLGKREGTFVEQERIIDLVEHWLVNDEQHIPRLCGGCDFIARIKGENE